MSLEEQIMQGERRGMNFEGFRTRLLVIEAKDTRMDINALNAFRISIGTRPSPQQTDGNQQAEKPQSPRASNSQTPAAQEEETPAVQENDTPAVQENDTPAANANVNVLLPALEPSQNTVPSDSSSIVVEEITPPLSSVTSASASLASSNEIESEESPVQLPSFDELNEIAISPTAAEVIRELVDSFKD